MISPKLLDRNCCVMMKSYAVRIVSSFSRVHQCVGWLKEFQVLVADCIYILTPTNGLFGQLQLHRIHNYENKSLASAVSILLSVPSFQHSTLHYAIETHPREFLGGRLWIAPLDWRTSPSKTILNVVKLFPFSFLTIYMKYRYWVFTVPVPWLTSLRMRVKSHLLTGMGMHMQCWCWCVHSYSPSYLVTISRAWWWLVFRCAQGSFPQFTER